jgi:hypothetical protein
VERTGRRFNPVTIGFWLGGFALGMGGCLIGACMPYRHPVGVTISVFWWGIYLGCFGAWLGGMFGLLWNDTPASPPSVGASGHRELVQADTGAAPYADLVTSPSSTTITSKPLSVAWVTNRLEWTAPAITAAPIYDVARQVGVTRKCC